MKPGAYLAADYERRLGGSTVRDASNIRTMPPPKPVTTDCRHRTPTLLAGGLAKCKDCGAVRGAGGVWRAV